MLERRIYAKNHHYGGAGVVGGMFCHSAGYGSSSRYSCVHELQVDDDRAYGAGLDAAFEAGVRAV